MKVGPNALDTTFLGYMDFTFLLSYAVGLATLGHLGDKMNLKYFTFCGMCVAALMLATIGII